MLSRFTKQKRGRTTIADLMFIVIFVTLLLLIVVGAVAPAVSFLFEPTVSGQSLFSMISVLLIFFYALLWGFLKIEDQIMKEQDKSKRVQNAISTFFRFIGIAKIGPSELLYIVLSMFAGIIFNMARLYGEAVSSGRTLFRMPFPSDIFLIVQILIIVPLFEELVFRGIYLSAFISILGRNNLSAALGLALSSITFGWIHTGQFSVLMIKTAGALMLGAIYLVRWRKNFLAAFLAHFGLNVVGMSLYVG